ncbi:MAG: DUF1573 domain-containing protein [bacterium]|nr:DUF1573 domain-containing protein [bacterium]
MESKTISIIAIVLLILFGLFIWGYSGKGSTTSSAASVQGAPGATSDAKSALAAVDVFYDFGTISMKNGDVTKDFTVTNPTGKDIFVRTVLSSCMCTSAFIVEPDGSLKGPFKMPGMGYVPPANETIKAGESRIIRVVYNPNAHGPAGVGQIDRFVTLMDEAGGILQLEIKALVTP